jgi:Ser/Thr protein kinase RdoA (MazF antagonist)
MIINMDRNEFLTNKEWILQQFGIDAGNAIIIPVQHGLINRTWKIETPGKAFILQKVNHTIFKKPSEVAQNLALIANYLSRHFPGYIFTAPLKTITGETLLQTANENYYRVFDYIEGSHSINSVSTAGQAWEAARQFGKFTSMLKNFDAAKLNNTIPSFHDLGLRYRQFSDAVQNGNTKRIKQSDTLIERLQNWSDIAATFEQIKNDPAFKLRVTHHDTKISNVLFDKNDKAICVIDLDTVMPGYFLSDIGDMMRTYLCPATEEEQDLEKIEVRVEIYNAIVQGYLHEMKEDLSEKEKQYFFYAGEYMIYMQALRFLTDHLNNDVYYGAAYPNQNFNRAANQAALLQQFIQLKDVIRLQKQTIA